MAENASQTFLASAIRSATTSSTTFENREWNGGTFVFDITSAPGTDTVTLSIVGIDTHSGKTWTILAGTALSATGTNTYRVFPSATASANAAANDTLPRRFKVTVTHSAGTNFTYSVTGHLVNV